MHSFKTRYTRALIVCFIILIIIIIMENKSDSSSEENRELNQEISDNLNIYSDKFDPMAFLFSNESKVPCPKAKVYDNIAMWYSNYKKRGDNEKKEKSSRKSEQIEPTRRWLPHQLPVESKRPQRITKNIFTRMEAIQGPLSVLRKYIDAKTKIKIVTRNEKGIRGYSIAYLLAFDKHFNLLLSDVDEVWKRSIKIPKNPVFMDSTSSTVSDNYKSSNKVRLPKIESKKISKNTEECKRHIEQMILRGENVVVIHPLYVEEIK